VVGLLRKGKQKKALTSKRLSLNDKEWERKGVQAPHRTERGSSRDWGEVQIKGWKASISRRGGRNNHVARES